MFTEKVRRAPQKPEMISGRLAMFAADLRYEDLPTDVKERDKMVLLDTLGCGLAGAGTEELRQIRQAMLDIAGNGGDVSLWGTRHKVPLPMAALANGAATHAREMDDRPTNHRPTTC